MRKSDTPDIRTVFLPNDARVPVVKELWLMILEAHVKGRTIGIMMTYKWEISEVPSDQFHILQ